MNILLVGMNAKYIHTNLAIRYIKAFIDPEYTAEIQEYTIKDPVFHIASKIIEKNPNIVGFSCYIWNIEQILKVAQVIKKALPTCIVVLGGPEVSYESEEWFEIESAIDCIIEGEGEETFLDLCHAIQNKQTLHHIKGVVFKKNNQVHRNEKRPPLDVRKLRSPYRFTEDLPFLSNRITYFETSRGCPFNCHFCLSSTEQGVRFFEMASIKADLLYLIDHGARTIKFLDRTFNTNSTFAIEIFTFLIENHRSGNVFQFEITADIMKPEVIEFLNSNAPKDLFRFEIGIQSTNEETNILVNRIQNFKRLRENILLIKKGGKIDLHLDLIAGLPKEDYRSFAKTFNDVFEMRPEELQFGFLKMLRGTPLRSNSSEHGYVYADYPPYEIICNDVLSFTEIQKMKNTEDILEKYWNSGKLVQVVEYLVDNVFESPWEFFERFGSFWHLQKWSSIGHQHIDLFNRLIQFLSTVKDVDLENIKGIMLLDYYNHYMHKPKKLLQQNTLEKEHRQILSKILENLFKETQVSINSQDLFKYTQVELTELNLLRFVKDGGIEKLPTYLCATYHPSFTKPVIHFINASEI